MARYSCCPPTRFGKHKAGLFGNQGVSISLTLTDSFTMSDIGIAALSIVPLSDSFRITDLGSVLEFDLNCGEIIFQSEERTHNFDSPIRSPL